MAKVHLVQCYCPRRHTIFGMAYETSDLGLNPKTAPGVLRETVNQWVAEGKINPYCEICGSQAFTYEDRPTRFNSIQEAMPELEAIQMRENLIRMAHDEQQKHRYN